MPRRKRPEEPRSPTNWLITYTDLCTLLLTFFVLLVSMSTVDKDRQKRAMGSLETSFGQMVEITEGRPVAAPDRMPRTLTARAVRELGVQCGLDPDRVRMEGGKMVIELDRKSLFKSGTTELAPKGVEFLAALADYLYRDPREIEIRGHTDLYETMGSPRWAEQSWDVSMRRANSVYGFFKDHGIEPRRMSSHGFGYNRPVVDSRLHIEAAERNQRVEIILNAPPKMQRPAESSPGSGRQNSFSTLFSK
ncbi:MAG: flagellar motor protein MotB [Acidobacteriota bacterium]